MDSSKNYTQTNRRIKSTTFIYPSQIVVDVKDPDSDVLDVGAWKADFGRWVTERAGAKLNDLCHLNRGKGSIYIVLSMQLGHALGAVRMAETLLDIDMAIKYLGHIAFGLTYICDQSITPIEEIDVIIKELYRIWKDLHRFCAKNSTSRCRRIRSMEDEFRLNNYEGELDPRVLIPFPTKK